MAGKLKTFLMCAVASLALAACSDEGAAKESLVKAGFEDIEITGYSPLSCGKDDFSSTGFKATNSHGTRVEGIVCCGLIFKECTIRF